MDDFTVKGRADMITESETRFHKPVNRTEDRSSKNTLAFGLIAQCSFYIHALRTLVILWIWIRPNGDVQTMFLPILPSFR